MDREPTARPSRATVWALAAPLIAIAAVANVAEVIWPDLVNRHPLLLVAMNARIRYLALTTNQLDWTPYYLVGFLRLVLPDPFYYLVGRHWGYRAVRWMERRLPSLGGAARLLERGFVRARWPLVFVMPNAAICLFAGASAMRVSTFAALNAAGTVARLAVVRTVGAVFKDPLDWVREEIAQYRLPLIALSAVLMALSLWSDARKGKGEIGALTHLDDDLVDPPDRPGGEPQP
ncbi:MAG: hypothetical protein ACKVWR_20300 [Acidimicrobiales bacterium]